MLVFEITVAFIFIMFFYFLFIWGFRIIAILATVKAIQQFKERGKEKLDEFKESMGA